MDGSLAFKVIPPEDDDEEGEGKDDGPAMCETAFKLWSREGIVPKVHLLGDAPAPGIEIYEFIEGTSASWIGTKHGPEFMENDEDNVAFGKLVGKLHSLPTDWYEPYKNDPKPQWESWQKGSKTDPVALEMREKYGDWAAQIHLFLRIVEGRGKNVRALAKSSLELVPLLQGQLTTEVMLSAVRVGHGDLHGCNLMHSKKDGHGDLFAIDLDFVGYNPAAYDLGTALAGTTSGAYGYFFLEGKPQGAYPSLESRRLLVATYLEALGDPEFSKTNVDDEVFDLEVGGMIRILWAGAVLAVLGFNNSPVHLGFAFLHYTKAAVNIFEQCKKDSVLKKKVTEEGVAKVFCDRVLELGLTPVVGVTPEQYKEHWNICGDLGPAFNGPFLPDDAAPGEEEKKEAALNSGHNTSLLEAALRFHDSTGADIKALFDLFDTDKSGGIELLELMNAAVMCGAGFKSMQEAEKTFSELDVDGDGNITLEEFKGFLKQV
ncbi:hypothetical protein ACHAXT_000982 [Thalassiosira profunda]